MKGSESATICSLSLSWLWLSVASQIQDLVGFALWGFDSLLRHH